MRYVYITNYFSPQLGYFETFLPREQSRLGHEVYVVTSDRYSHTLYKANKDLLKQRIKGAGFFEEEGLKVWRLKICFELYNQVWLTGLDEKIKELKPDIVHIGGIDGLTAVRIARLKRKNRNFKLIYNSSMTFDNSTSALRLLYPFFRIAFARLLNEAADALVGASEACREFLNKQYGFPLERITVVPLGADIELFRFDSGARRKIRAELPVSDGDTLFIYTGKIIPEKKLELLIEAVSRMGKSSRASALIIGSGPSSYIKELKQQAANRRISDSFFWHDAVPNRELYRYYSAADAAVWPRGASIGQREAMACGLPIILSEYSLVAELLENGQNGLVCKENNAADLAQQMEKLLDPALRKQMGQSSRKYAEDNLNWNTIALRFLEMVS